MEIHCANLPHKAQGRAHVGRKEASVSPCRGTRGRTRSRPRCSRARRPPSWRLNGWAENAGQVRRGSLQNPAGPHDHRKAAAADCRAGPAFKQQPEPQLVVAAHLCRGTSCTPARPFRGSTRTSVQMRKTAEGRREEEGHHRSNQPQLGDGLLAPTPPTHARALWASLNHEQPYLLLRDPRTVSLALSKRSRCSASLLNLPVRRSSSRFSAELLIGSSLSPLLRLPLSKGPREALLGCGRAGRRRGHAAGSLRRGDTIPTPAGVAERPPRLWSARQIIVRLSEVQRVA